MRRLAPAALLLPAGHAHAEDIIYANLAQLAALLQQPVALLMDFADEPVACVDKQTIANRTKAVMSRYRIPRAEKVGPDHQTAIYIDVVAFEMTNQAGQKGGCAAHVAVQLESAGDGFWAQWASVGGLFVGPNARTGVVADEVQKFIEALVAKAADPAVASAPLAGAPGGASGSSVPWRRRTGAFWGGGPARAGTTVEGREGPPGRWVREAGRQAAWSYDDTHPERSGGRLVAAAGGVQKTLREIGPRGPANPPLFGPAGWVRQTTDFSTKGYEECTPRSGLSSYTRWTTVRAAEVAASRLPAADAPQLPLHMLGVEERLALLELMDRAEGEEHFVELLAEQRELLAAVLAMLDATAC